MWIYILCIAHLSLLYLFYFQVYPLHPCKGCEAVLPPTHAENAAIFIFRTSSMGSPVAKWLRQLHKEHVLSAGCYAHVRSGSGGSKRTTVGGRGVESSHYIHVIYIHIWISMLVISLYEASIITISNSKSAMERVSEQGSKSPSGRHLNPVIKWPQLQSRLSLSIPPKEHPPKTSKDFQRSTLQYLQLLFGYLYSGWQGQIHLDPLHCWKNHNFC